MQDVLPKFLPCSQRQSDSPCIYRCAAAEVRNCNVRAVRACQRYSESGSGSQLERYDTAVQPHIAQPVSCSLRCSRTNRLRERAAWGSTRRPAASSGSTVTTPARGVCANCLTELEQTVADHYQEIDANPQVAVFPYLRRRHTGIVPRPSSVPILATYFL
jgi:hypothetical protein